MSCNKIELVDDADGEHPLLQDSAKQLFAAWRGHKHAHLQLKKDVLLLTRQELWPENTLLNL